ncbi:trichohyalin isoform X2 [Triplophysa dalaica]|uniref:trichohyalin isoform X2 n=1 Tax=Triplophysa dalaica TaxID=1582913 RepID=UPI0024DF78DB|nr:trichohyalin isoform X2 [Triplophysa dalaica]
MVLLRKVSSILFCLTLTKFGLISCVLYVENGTSLNLDPGMKGTPEDILWTFNEDKVAERDVSDFQEYGRFIKRTEIEFTTGRLRVHRMTRDDSGFYKVMIQINGKLQFYEVDVEVIDGVPEPQVTCELNSSSQSRHLLCSMTDEINVTYTWTGPDGPQSGQTLEIDKDVPSESLYICAVKNPVSQKNKSIILRDCSTGSDGLNLHLIIITLVIIGVILIVGAALVIYFKCWRNKRKQMPPEAAEAMRLLDSPGKQNLDEKQSCRDDHEDLCEHNNEGEIMGSQDSDGNTDENISEQNKDVQSESKKIHESDQNRVQRVHEGTLNNEGVNMINQETKSNTDENISEQKKEDVQSESEQIDELNVHDGDQNRVQRVNEDDGTLNNEGAGVMIQETKSKTEENISEQKKDDIQSELEQIHESEYSEEEKEEDLKMSCDGRESVDTNEQKDCINKDSQSENCSDELSEHQEVNERNFGDQSEHPHDSDEDRKQIISECREDLTEEEEGNTDEGAEENIPEKSEEEPKPDVKKRVMDIERGVFKPKS